MRPDDDNPYQAPASAVADIHVVSILVDAGKWRRLFNWLLDHVAILGVVLVMMIVAILVGGESAMDWVDNMGFWQEQLVGIAVMLGYYIVMEGMFGLTLGKLITRTRVVDEQGAPPTWRQAVLRSLARLIPFEAFSVLFGEDGVARGWHDRLPRTRVVMRTPRAGQAGIIA